MFAVERRVSAETGDGFSEGHRPEELRTCSSTSWSISASVSPLSARKARFGCGSLSPTASRARALAAWSGFMADK